MRYRKVISETVTTPTGRVTVAGAINAVIAVNAGKAGESSHVATKQRVKVVQRNGRTEVFECKTETEGEGDDREEE